MSEQYCPECGHENPINARFCMDCGRSLTPESAPSVPHVLSTAQGSEARRRRVERPVRDQGQQPAAVYPPGRAGTDWAGIGVSILALLSLQHMSRKWRQTTIIVVLFMLLFGCPMVCGILMFFVDSVLKLFR